ncbi:hypothetical protein BBK82_21195 [Lentzea guizhouensis]|uniref:Uncharacterized protein n=1 Tax=Lentzea guizhouensis TaxID=1586287 RepID=A0A1B2HKF1_9PSEU|nr:hypothetical protein [Lentzea guizhouensis]ANZ38204.1 hypothetical protein BBK82_21195 [Lentzea guizhouensis]
MTKQNRTSAHPSTGTLVAAWAVPVLVVGQFGLISGIPMLITLAASLRDRRSRALRWWTGGLTLAYAGLVTAWLAGPSEAPSLSKYMSPAVTALLAAGGAAVAVAHHVVRRRSAVPAVTTDK